MICLNDNDSLINWPAINENLTPDQLENFFLRLVIGPVQRASQTLTAARVEDAMANGRFVRAKLGATLATEKNQRTRTMGQAVALALG